MRSIEEREIVNGQSLVAAPAEMVKALKNAGSTAGGQSISPAELQRLVDGGVDPFRMHTEEPQYANHSRDRNINLLCALLARGNAPCLRWLMERYDLSKFLFTGELGRHISKELVAQNSSQMVMELVEAGLRRGAILDTLHQVGKSPFERSFGASVTQDYDVAISNAPQLAFVEAMRKCGELEKPGVVFSQLLNAQSSVSPTMHMVRHFSRACGGVQATDFSEEGSRQVIARMLLGLTGKDRQEALAQLKEWGFDRYPVCEDFRHSTPMAKIYDGATELGEPLLEFLRAAQFDLEEPDAKGKTALILAVEKGDLRAVKWLVTHGARLDAQTAEGDSVMHCAVRNGNLEQLDYLFAVGASHTVRNRVGRTPLGLYSNGCVGSDYLSLLIGRTIPMGRNLAMLAFSEGCHEKLEEAIKAGDDVNALDDEGSGIAQRITQKARQNPRVWELLGEAGFNFDVLVTPHNAKDKDHKVPLLHLYCEQGQNNKANSDVVRYMVRAGANPDIKDGAGQTALHVAIKALNRHAVEALLEMGADPTIKLGNRTTLQLTKDEEIKRILAGYRTGRVVTNAMGGVDASLSDPEQGASSDPSPI